MKDKGVLVYHFGFTVYDEESWDKFGRIRCFRSGDEFDIHIDGIPPRRCEHKLEHAVATCLEK